MPVPLRTTYHKAEAKYNVTTEFPSLGLHSAAATGNVGLVEYALDHGQPINSVLDGVLPLHAACAGGNVQVVKLLIDHGADVNAPRLPRRYSNDKNRDSSAPIVGTSGSTPLHFAAANGNTEAVTLLLLHGAHANRADKHGITPEMLARQHGWLECAEVLKDWLANKDRDLRERPGGGPDDSRSIAPSGPSNRERLGSFSGDADHSAFPPMRRRIHVKQSIDTALNMLKSSSADPKPQPPSTFTNIMTSTPPASPTRPFGEYTFHPTPPTDDDQLSPVDGGSRRPSLPHIMQPPSVGPSCIRKTSTPNINSSPSPRRPRSAGTGAEDQELEPNTSAGRSGGVRKLGSKYSLMNIFKKAQTGEPGQSTDASQPMLSTPALASGSATGLPLSTSPNVSGPMSNPHPSTNLPEASSSSASFVRTGFRFHRGSDASTRTLPQQPLNKPSMTTNTPPRAPVPLAVDLHNALAQDRQDRHQYRQTRDRSRSTGSGARFNPEENTKPTPSPGSSPLTRLGLRARGHKRDRSGSGGSLGTDSSPGYRGGAVFDDDLVVVAGEGGSSDAGKPGTRPSILKAHNRTSSSGHVPGTPSGFRALRFDSTSSANSNGRRGDSDAEGLGPTHGLRGSNSVGSLGKYRRTPASPHSRLNEEDLIPDSAPATVSDFEGRPGNGVQPDELPGDDEEDDAEYGQPLIHGEESPVIDTGVPEPKSPRMALLMRERGLSFASSSESSLSPIMSSDGHENTALINAEFPFSINRPPPMYSDDAETTISPKQELLRVPPIGDNRSRGDSVSSTSTSDSRHNPQLSASGTTSGSGGSDTITTPWFSSPGREAFLNVSTDSSPGRNVEGLIIEDVNDDDLAAHVKTLNTNSLGVAPTVLNERRSHVPPDINISSISSHAQAEALVQKAQQDILEMALANELTSATTSTGRSPLSARLAAYGESLALERKLREQKQAEEEWANTQFGMKQASSTGEGPIDSGTTSKTDEHSRRDGVERQHSLEHRTNKPKLKSRMKDPKRPSTAEGAVSRNFDQSMFGDFPGRTHQPSRSASGFGRSPPSRLSMDQDNSSSDEQDPLPVQPKSAALPKTKPETHTSHSRIISRSRTPLPPDSGDGQLSRISSLEAPDTDTELGPSLLRVSTAPMGPVRGAKTNTKLARMGFPSTEQARVTATPSNSKRFGAIRSLVQTLKGKT